MNTRIKILHRHTPRVPRIRGLAITRGHTLYATEAPRKGAPHQPAATAPRGLGLLAAGSLSLPAAAAAADSRRGNEAVLFRPAPYELQLGADTLARGAVLSQRGARRVQKLAEALRVVVAHGGDELC